MSRASLETYNKIVSEGILSERRLQTLRAVIAIEEIDKERTGFTHKKRDKMNGLDLFSGIGGISKALKGKGVRTVAYCENDKYAQGVLLSRMRSGDIDTAPIWDDIRTLRKKHLPKIDIISGGFPCQDISVAGNGKGLDGKRSGLFFEIVRLARILRPSFLFLENVPAITHRGLDRIILELHNIGFDCRWNIVSAAHVGAPHLRKRFFLLAYSRNCGHRQLFQQIKKQEFQEKTNSWSDGKIQSLANSNSMRELSKTKSWNIKRNWISHSGWWLTEPDVGRVVDGIQYGSHRIRCLGNSVVSEQVEYAIDLLNGTEN